MVKRWTTGLQQGDNPTPAVLLTGLKEVLASGIRRLIMGVGPCSSTINLLKNFFLGAPLRVGLLQVLALLTFLRCCGLSLPSLARVSSSKIVPAQSICHFNWIPGVRRHADNEPGLPLIEEAFTRALAPRHPRNSDPHLRPG